MWVHNESSLVEIKPSPGLIIEWRRDADTWCASVATAQGEGALFVHWCPADQLTPVSDDAWELLEVERHPKRSRRG